MRAHNFLEIQVIHEFLEIQEFQEFQEIEYMAGDKADLGKGTLQPNRNVTIPRKVASIWGLEKGERAILYFRLNKKGQVLVVPGDRLAEYFRKGGD